MSNEVPLQKLMNKKINKTKVKKAPINIEKKNDIKNNKQIKMNIETNKKESNKIANLEEINNLKISAPPFYPRNKKKYEKYKQKKKSNKLNNNFNNNLYNNIYNTNMQNNFYNFYYNNNNQNYNNENLQKQFFQMNIEQLFYYLNQNNVNINFSPSKNQNLDSDNIKNIVLNKDSKEYFPRYILKHKNSDDIKNFKLNLNSEEYIPNPEVLKNQEKEERQKRKKEEEKKEKKKKEEKEKIEKEEKERIEREKKEKEEKERMEREEFEKKEKERTEKNKILRRERKLKTRKEKEERQRRLKEEKERKEKEDKEKRENKRKEQEEQNLKNLGIGQEKINKLKYLFSNSETKNLRRRKITLDNLYIINKINKIFEFDEKLEESVEKKNKKKEKNKINKEKYFINIIEDKNIKNKEYKYSIEYIFQFKNWKICKETELLTKFSLNHINTLIKKEKEFNDKDKFIRKDLAKELIAADEFKKKLEEKIQEDPIKRNLREYLNMLTIDNYENIKKQIFGIIKNSIEYQEKFLDVIFQKAVMEKAYVRLYAQLCKEFDKELPQKKTEEKIGKSTSFMRIKLLDKCREIFTNKEKINEYIKEKDPIERENKLKNFIIGNVNFITELISIKMLSKRIAPNCINYLLERIEEKSIDLKLKLIDIQAIIIFTDKLGTLINLDKNKIKNFNFFNENLEKIFSKLEIIKNDKNLPGYLKYSIINLIEKKKNNYKKTKYEEYIIAKSKKELEEEIEKENITQNDINDKIKNGLNEYKDFVQKEGNSKNYPWKEIIYLYEMKEKKFEDILKGYIVSSGDFIEKAGNIKYAKDYIKELIEYYKEKFNKEEKIELRKRILNLFYLIKDIAFETPLIYGVYSFTLFIFIQNKIMKIKNLENIIKEDDEIENMCIVNNIFKEIYKHYEKNIFKRKLKKFVYIDKNKELFEWIFEDEQTENVNDKNSEN